jgi:hypothetical protein
VRNAETNRARTRQVMSGWNRVGGWEVQMNLIGNMYSTLLCHFSYPYVTTILAQYTCMPCFPFLPTLLVPLRDESVVFNSTTGIGTTPGCEVRLSVNLGITSQ